MKTISNTILAYDCETTGMPVFKEPSDSEVQPHIVSIAAVLCNIDTQKVISSIDLIVKPDNWTIPEEMTAIHGITTEHATEVGVPEGFAVMMLQLLCGESQRVAYNAQFDKRIVRIASKRYLADELIDRWAIKEDHHDSMRMAQKVYGGKNMKLEDAYKKVTGKTLTDAHTEMSDTMACLDIFFSLKDHEKVK
ncbi:MAG: 3'-5' exonuclease [Thiomicrorhabdus sp.]|nr:3'-5' exonuclease [Thiomicrorhabdus sp.]